jgi:mRNA-degrading endonuclease RelE of RelBE toxin-antitoxin system
VGDAIGRLHPDLKRKVRAGIDAIREDPLAGKPLQDDLAGLRSLRIGRARIIYRTVGRGVIEVIAVGSRRTIYEETLRLLQRRQGEP